MNMVNWSELPEELVSKIADNIVAAEDFVAFRATCKPWQSAVQTNQCNPRVPTLFFVDSSDNVKCLDHNNQRISQRKESCAWGSACGWIFADNHLVNPLTNATISLPEDRKSKDLEIKRVLVFKRPASWSFDKHANRFCHQQVTELQMLEAQSS
ncbi:hypothetical protein POM88_001626 [Heracleum sosnowskyi]|uniref:F-box domain-containing protein n=1 Tax=Heracleum sosnowskyi TaxID=360622 RepID=A0AAD8N9S9_9APIA|nr:hypothetical protein POM88_001622 [Heracleum sosnowskyi]KAK1402019.1 hypothetical protein POM88_001624 [Heracleum sosnowskyi]KAK1402021.1 hypothetical protein POM88_001626 [Heracleum sosnowskyi]